MWLAAVEVNNLLLLKMVPLRARTYFVDTADDAILEFGVPV